MSETLNLGHVGATATGRAELGASRARHEDGDDEGGHVANPAKPQEGSRGLSLAAALGHVV